jgi:DNA repair exonuclease SbcCD ATPase subunit
VLIRASLGLAAALLCAGGARASEAAPPEKKKDVPAYTDEDLRRVSPLRDQTGGGMAADSPAGERSADAQAERPAAAEKARGKDEAHWRREWERLRERLQPLRDRADDLRAQIEERRRVPGVRPYSDPRVESLQRRLAALEARIREAEDLLHERARRAGALPGWLR